MSLNGTTTIKVNPLPGGFGARVEFDTRTPPDLSEAQAIAQAFHAHQVLIFEGADLTLAQLAAFVRAFGTQDDGSGRLASDSNEYAGIRVVENVEKGKFGPRSNSELDWHSDRFFDPVVAGLLNSVVVPKEGGDTSFCDLYRALEELPVALRQAIEGRRIKQDVVFDAQGKPGMRPGGVKLDDVMSSPGVETDMVQFHRFTRKPFLFLGNRLNAYVPDLPLEESEALLDALFAHVDQPQFHYRHHWAAHELILYDNRCCMHRREAFDENAERKLYASVVDRSDIL
ncbi:TauD/TfdA dioxygenase family protein [Pseudomonas kilonensis]|uniref:Taurine dioxygenase n=1 Tax=Pseudomonas kilonensis TaxID=132476 RepID=A0ABY0ZHC5_9PSED|nr:TauD/TfdA family dioxygenase [Pseudomonas kilonensis]SEE69015.1 taurine dioxygenase [Pseudomonas kilonensis]